MNGSADVFSFGNDARVLDVLVDVHEEELWLLCRLGGERIERTITNRTADILLMLHWLRTRGKAVGYGHLRVVVEPTGVYHKLLLEIAARMNMQTALVSTEAVKQMRKVLFGPGKTDRRDPYVIEDLAGRGRVLKHRRLGETYELMRRWNVLYDEAEEGMVTAKNHVHRCLRALFPDFDFGTDFLYGPSGSAILNCYGLNPHSIVAAGIEEVGARLKKLVPRIRRSSIERLLAYAEASVQSTPDGRLNQVLEHELRIAWEDLKRNERRRIEAGVVLETLLDEAHELDGRIPQPTRGLASKLNLARVIAETGPLSDFDSWRQVLKYGGINLCERESGKYRGKTKISKRGRSRLRKVLTQMALPLVKKGRLFGDYYHHKRTVEKMEGTSAMTAVARKILKVIWGLYSSGRAFDPARVFTCESQFERQAA